jgi:membrane protein
VIVAVIVGGNYRFSIDGPVPVRNLIPGAVFSSVGVLLVGTGFVFYVASSTHYTAVYGTLAGVAVGMIAAYLATYIVLIGAVVNVQLPLTGQSAGDLMDAEG